MINLQTGESYTNRTTKDLTVIIKYLNLFGLYQTDIRVLSFNQTFTKTQPLTKVTILF
jgi:hypothetical protein